MDLVYERRGSGEPLLLLHGLFGSWRNLRPLGQMLADKREVFLVDLRNHGDSPHDTQVGYGAMAADLLELTDQLDLRRVDLLGHSMGGKVAMEFAVRYPDRARSLVVLDISPAQSPPDHEGILRALAAADPASAGTREEIDRRLQSEIPSPAVRQFLLTNLVRDGSGYRWRMNLEALRHSYADLLAPVGNDGAFEGPALFLRGARSTHLPDEDIPLVRRIFPHARIDTIADAGHWVHVDAPGAVFEEVERFLQSPAGG